MNIVLQKKYHVQLHKKRLLEREIAWIKKEFKDFHTINDIELYNTETALRFQLGMYSM